MNSNQIGRNTKLKTIFQTSTPPKHQTQKSNPYFQPPNTKSKPKFSAPKHKTQNPNFLIFRETKQKPQIQTLEPKPNHLQPQIRSYQIQIESTSDQPKQNSLLSSFSCLLGVWIWEDKGERKRETERMGLCGFGIVWVLMKRRGWKTKKENVVLVFKFGLVFFLFFLFFFLFFFWETSR